VFHFHLINLGCFDTDSTPASRTTTRN
jgi:hypothetical protein